MGRCWCDKALWSCWWKSPGVFVPLLHLTLLLQEYEVLVVQLQDSEGEELEHNPSGNPEFFPFPAGKCILSLARALQDRNELGFLVVALHWLREREFEEAGWMGPWWKKNTAQEASVFLFMLLFWSRWPTYFCSGLSKESATFLKKCHEEKWQLRSLASRQHLR